MLATHFPALLSDFHMTHRKEILCCAKVSANACAESTAISRRSSAKCKGEIIIPVAYWNERGRGLWLEGAGSLRTRQNVDLPLQREHCME